MQLHEPSVEEVCTLSEDGTRAQFPFVILPQDQPQQQLQQPQKKKYVRNLYFFFVLIPLSSSCVSAAFSDLLLLIPFLPFLSSSPFPSSPLFLLSLLSPFFSLSCPLLQYSRCDSCCLLCSDWDRKWGVLRGCCVTDSQDSAVIQTNSKQCATSLHSFR